MAEWMARILDLRFLDFLRALSFSVRAYLDPNATLGVSIPWSYLWLPTRCHDPDLQPARFFGDC